MNCVLVGQVNDWEKNDSSNHAACYEAPKGDMVMEKIDIGWKIILQFFCVCSKQNCEKTQKPFALFCKNFAFVWKTGNYIRWKKKKCVSMLCVHLQKFAFVHMMRNWLWK